jgi:hypothetical protein
MTPLLHLCSPDHSQVTGCLLPKVAGVMVEIGPHRGPRYCIRAVEGEDAWLRAVVGDGGSFAPLDHLRVVG